MAGPGAPDVATRRERAAVFAGVAVVLLAYALRGATYDVVDRAQAGLLAWWVLGLGVATGVLPRALPGRAALLLAGGLLALAGLTALSFAWTASDERTGVELARTVHHLGVVALALAVLRRRTAPAAVAGAATAAAVVCALSLGQRLFPGAFPDDPVEATFAVGRLNYPLDYWNGLAAWAAMATAMALAWSAHARAPAWRAAALAAVPPCAAVVYLTYSRAGAAGAALGAVLVVAVSRARLPAAAHLLAAAAAAAVVVAALRAHPDLARGTGTGGRWAVLAVLAAAMAACAAAAAGLARWGRLERLAVPRRAAAAVLGTALAAGVVAAAAVAPAAWEDFRGTAAPVGPAVADPASRLSDLGGNRYPVWRAAVQAWRAHPVRGTGPGTFEFWWNRKGANAEFVRDAHNVYLEALAELGWPGLLALLAACAGAVAAVAAARRRARRSREVAAATAAAAVLGLWLFHAGVDWIWEETAVTALALLVAAAVGAPASRRHAPVPVPARIAAVLACVAAVLVQLPPAVGTSAVRESQAAVGAGDLGRARALADDAVAAWPWAATPLVQRALVAAEAGELPAAVVDARRAERREPHNWRTAFLLSRLLAADGRPAAARVAYERARRLRPLSPVFAAPPPGTGPSGGP